MTPAKLIRHISKDATASQLEDAMHALVDEIRKKRIKETYEALKQPPMNAEEARKKLSEKNNKSEGSISSILYR